MRKGKDPDPDPYLWLMDLIPNQGGPKTFGSGSGSLTRSVVQVLVPVFRIRDVYPGSRILIFTPSRILDPESGILDPKTATKERGKKICCNTFFYSHKFHKLLGQFSKNYRTFYPKSCHLALQNMGLGSGIREAGSRIQKKPIPDPGSRGQKGTGSRIRNTDWYSIRPPKIGIHKTVPEIV